MKKLLSFIISIILLFSLAPGSIAKAATIVNIPDNNLASALSSIIGKPANAITENDINDLSGIIELHNKNITDLTGLEKATNITSLSLYTNNISDISPLAALTNLTNLNIQDNPIIDLTPLGSLVNLTDLSLPSERTFVNYQAMATLTKLQQLYAPLNNISDISFMQNMTELTSFDLPDNGIKDLTPLTGHTKLDYVNLTNNNVSDVNPLLNSVNMRELSLAANNIDNSDLNDLKILTKLQQLQIGITQISEISPIASMTNLQMLNVQDSQVHDISVLAGLSNLQMVYLQGNYITDLLPLEGLTHLQDNFVHVESNFINTFSGYNKTILNNLGITTNREPQNRIALDPSGQQSFTINVGEELFSPVATLSSNDGNSWAMWNGVNPEDLTLTSSDEGIAKPYLASWNSWYIKGVSGGTAQITATFRGIDSEYTKTIFDVTVQALTPAPEGSITIKYHDENNKNIAITDVIRSLDLGLYTENAKVIDGYTLNDNNSKTVILTEGSLNQTIVFTYKKNEAPQPVITGTVEGTVKDIDGKPLKGVKVELHSNPRYTLTDENGHYIFTDVELGDHAIKISDTNYSFIKEIRIFVKVDENNNSITKVVDSDTASQDLNLSQDRNKRIIDFVVVPTAAPTTQEITPIQQPMPLPQTGDTSTLGYSSILLIILLGILLLILRRKKAK